MELHARERARRVLAGLVAYQAVLELSCIAISAGGTRIRSVERLPALCSDYSALVKNGGPDVVRLIVAHRELMEQLCRIRERRNPATARAMRERLMALRERHAAIVARLVQELRSRVS